MKAILSQDKSQKFDDGRTAMLNKIYYIGAIAGIPVILFNIFSIRDIGWNIGFVIRTSMVIILLLIAFAGERLSYQLRAGLVTAIPFIVGISEYYTSGIVGSGAFWLYVSIVTSITLFGTGFSRYVIVAAFFVAGFFGATYSLNIIDYQIDILSYAYSPSIWFQRNIVTIGSGSAIVVILGVLHDKLINYSLFLEEAKQGLSSEIDRRKIVENELEGANQRLRELDHMKDVFLNNISHELKTPTANIKLYHQLLARRPEKGTEYTKIINDEVKRLETIVDGILFITKIKQDMSGRTLSDVNLVQILKEEIANITVGTEEPKLMVSFKSPEQLVWVKGAPMLLRRVCNELLDNAIKYASTDTEIIVELHKNKYREKDIEIRFINKVPSMNPEEINLLFTSFYRGEGSQSGNIPGVGLGLAIAKQVIEAHQGSIHAEYGPSQNKLDFVIWLEGIEEGTKNI